MDCQRPGSLRTGAPGGEGVAALGPRDMASRVWWGWLSSPGQALPRDAGLTWLLRQRSIPALPRLALFQLNRGKWFRWECQNHPRLFDICTKENSRASRTSSQQFSSKCPAKTGQLFLRGTLRKVCYYPHCISRETEAKWLVQGHTEKEGDRIKAVAV